MGFAIGCAAPPPITGGRGGGCVGVACAAGDGDGETAGFAAGPSFEAGGGVGAVQPSMTLRITTKAPIMHLSGPKDTR